MGKHFGELSYIRHVIQYSLSPFEQKAFAGMITKGIPNTIRRMKDATIRVGPPAILGYLVYTAGEKEHDRLMRKNPEDYVNDK